MLTDWRGVMRRWRIAPGAYLVAVMTLGVGTGVAAAAFVLLQHVILRALPYENPDRLVALREQVASEPPVATISSRLLFELQPHNETFERLGGFDFGSSITLLDGVDVTRATVVGVSRGLLPTLGVPPVAGRWFDSSDQTDGDGRPALITNELFKTRFGGDPTAIGRPIRTDKGTLIIVGVLPASFRFPRPTARQPDLLVLLPRNVETGAVNRRLFGIARLRPRLTTEQAQRAGQAVFDRLPSHAEVRQQLALLSLHDSLNSTRARNVWFVFGAAALAFGVACLNFIGLLLGVMPRRTGEFLTRAALGASHATLRAQLVRESLALSLIGAVIAVAVGFIVGHVARANLPQDFQYYGVPAFSGSAAIAAIALCLLVGLIAGAVLPLRPPTGRDAMGGGAYATDTRSRLRFQRGLLVAESALAVMATCGAVALVNTLAELSRTPLGFDTTPVLSVELRVPSDRLSSDNTRRQFYESVVDDLRGLPGVTASAAVDSLPLSGATAREPFMVVASSGEHRTVADGETRRVTADYFTAMGIPTHEGRGFQKGDPRNETLAIVTRTTAERYWPGTSALGQIVQLPDAVRREIVGVVEDSRETPFTDLAPGVYVTIPPKDVPTMSLLLRTDGGALVSPDAVRRVIQQRIGAVPLPVVTSMRQLYRQQVAHIVFPAMLFAAAGFLSLALLLAGLHATVMTYLSLRLKDVAVRRALGATGLKAAGGLTRAAIRPLVLGTMAGVVAWMLTQDGLRTVVAVMPPKNATSLLVAVSLVLMTMGLTLVWAAASCLKSNVAESLRQN